MTSTQIIIEYPQEQYDFVSVIQKMFECDDLTQLHKKSDKDYPLFNEYTDQDSIFHKIFYSKMNEEFLPLYNKFLLEGLKPNFFHNQALVAQKIPTFRCHLPGNLAVGSWHKDRDFGHDPAELNFWMPFTPTFDTNTIWIESEEDKGDFEAIKVEPNEIFVFDGANLKHGNKTNETGQTRVSVDFRIMLKDRYKPSDKVSLTKMTKFEIGQYWMEV